MIDATNTTPRVFFDGDKGILQIEGNSLVSNATSFYENIIDEVIDYKKHPVEILILDIYIDYMNTSSAKMIYELFLATKGLNAKVIWKYTEEEMLEAGIDYESLVNDIGLKFEFVKIDQ